MHWFNLILIVAVLLVCAVYVFQLGETKQITFYQEWQFPKLSQLHENWKQIRDEALSINKISKAAYNNVRTFAKIKELIKDWYNNDSWHEFYLDSDYKNSVLLFPLMFDSKPIGKAQQIFPRTVNLLMSTPGVIFASFGKVKKGTNIKEHSSREFGLFNDILAYALNLSGRGNFYINGFKERMEPGKVLIFDPSMKHSGNNYNNDDWVFLSVGFAANN